MNAGKATTSQIGQLFQSVLARLLPNGGFTDQLGGTYRPDATAWAIIALHLSGTRQAVIERARLRLTEDQEADGRLSISRDHYEAFWPTPLAILAWHHSPAYREAQSRAVQFLLRTTGKHFVREQDDPVGHDAALKGWPWIDDTHSWVEPTALSIMAIHVCGFGDHGRVREAVRLLMDRQLPHGGWNYGNTSVFGQELHPSPESTGAALHALEGRAARSQVQTSLDYLLGRIARLRTPLALGWSILGLRSWDLVPPDAHQLIERCLGHQERFGSYETASLCLLLCSAVAPKGLYIGV